MTKKSGETTRPILIISGWPLVNQLVALASEPWKEYAIAITPLGYDIMDFNLWS